MSDTPPPPPPPAEPPPPPPPPPAAPSARPAGRRRIVVALLVVLALVAASVTVVLVVTRKPAAPTGRPAPKTAKAPPATVPQLIMEKHANSDGVLDLGGALQMFSYAVAPLPGITLPTGGADVPAKWGDVAMNAIYEHIGELTPDQEKVVMPYFTDVAGGGTTIAPASPAPTGTPDIVLDRVFLNLPGPGQYVRADLTDLIAKAFKDEGGTLGHSFGDAPANGSLSDIQLFLTNAQSPSAWTICTNGIGFDGNGQPLPTANTQGRITNCAIFVGISIWGADQNGHLIATDDDIAKIYHEVFHCFQNFVIGSVSGDVAVATPKWVIEGGATWAAASRLPYDDEGWWNVYLQTPQTSLYARAYDAFGFFFEVEHLGRALWPEWWQIWEDASHGGWGTPDWFVAVAGDKFSQLLNAWGSSFYRDPALGHDWTVEGTGQLKASPAPTPADPVMFNGQLDISTQPYATYQVQIPQPSNPNAVVVAQANESNIRAQDSVGAEQVGRDLMAFCWNTCGACPGSSGNPAALHVSGNVWLAYTAIQKWGDLQLATLAGQGDYCKLKKKPDPKQPCPQSCGGSNGDPHLTTVNRGRYEFQAAGEYELVRSPDGKVEAQTRQEPMPGVAGPTGMTVNTAVAVRLGTHRAGVYERQGATTLDVHVDGATVPLTSAMDVGGGKLVRINGGVEIDLPDGSALYALCTSVAYGINVQLLPSDALRKSATGLLGVMAPGYVLPLLPDGTGQHVSGALTAKYDFTYQKFAPAWRITDATTLFDYDSGKSTKSYDVPGFVPQNGPPQPHPYGSTSGFDPAKLQAAMAACDAVSADLRGECAWDVGASGDTGYAKSYVAIGTAFTGTSGGSGGPGPSPTPSSGSTAKVVLSSVDNVRSYAAGPDGTLYVLARVSNVWQLLAIDPASTTVRTQVAFQGFDVAPGIGVGGGSLWLLTSPTVNQCQVEQRDPGTLAVQATMPLSGCPIGPSPAIAATNDQVWVAGDKQDVERIDMASKKVSQTVTVKSTTASGLYSSATNVFWNDESGVYRVDASSSSLVDLNAGGSTILVPAFSSDGLWTPEDSATVGFWDGGQTASKEVSAGRDLIGADDRNVYIEDPTSKQVLWFPIDGSQGGALGQSAVDSVGSPLVTGPHNVYRVYMKPPPSGGGQALWVENYPLP